jgi:hypothetical protein
MMYRFRLVCSLVVAMAEFSLSDLRSATQSAFSMRTMIFPMLLIGLDLGASVVYAVALDWRRHDPARLQARGSDENHGP